MLSLNLNRKLPLMLAATLLVPAACGNSPLFNHVDESDRAASAESTQTVPGGCQLVFPKANLCASVSWGSPPSADAESDFTLRFWDKTTGAVTGPFIGPKSTVAVKLLMPSMGHGSSPVQINSTEPGVYAVTKVYFIMTGAWEVHVQLKNGARVIEEAVLPVSL